MGYDWHSQVALLGVCEFSEFCACKGVLPCKSDFVKSAPKFNNSCSNGVLNDRDPAVRSEINCAHTQSLNGFQTQKLNQSILAFRNEWLWYDPICVVHCSCPMWCWNLSTSLKSSCPSRLHISYHWVQFYKPTSCATTGAAPLHGVPDQVSSTRCTSPETTCRRQLSK